jgi:tRNA pseudouridine38-40 synthase
VFATADVVIGEHDFTSFAAVDPDQETRSEVVEREEDFSTSSTYVIPKHATNFRTIFESSWSRREDEIIYTVRGSGFLHHMVRNLVGTFLLAGKGSIAPTDITRILEAKDRSAAGPTAPASGLWLVRVEY